MIEFRNVSLSYGSAPVFEGFSFTIARGEFITVVGPFIAYWITKPDGTRTVNPMAGTADHVVPEYHRAGLAVEPMTCAPDSTSLLHSHDPKNPFAPVIKTLRPCQKFCSFY